MCLIRAQAEVQIEMAIVVASSMNVTQFTGRLLDPANASTSNGTALPAISLVELRNESSILCLLGLFCFSDGEYTYFTTPPPKASETQPELLAGYAVAGVGALCLCSVLLVCLVYSRRARLNPRKGKVAIRAEIDWPPKPLVNVKR